MICLSQDSSTWQLGFLKVLPAVQTHARIKFSRLATARRKETVQEAVAAACVIYQKAVDQGRAEFVRSSTLADFAVRHVRTGRHVSGSHDGVRDVLSCKCQKVRGITVREYPDDTARGKSGNGSRGWEQVACVSRRTRVPDLAGFRIDFAGWLKTLPKRDSKIIAALAEGLGTTEVAGRFGITPARISQGRRRNEREWAIYHCEQQPAA